MPVTQAQVREYLILNNQRPGFDNIICLIPGRARFYIVIEHADLTKYVCSESVWSGGMIRLSPARLLTVIDGWSLWMSAADG